MRDIYVVKHTESFHHIEGRVGGWYDTGLTDRGQRQAEAVAERLVELITDPAPRIVSSDLARARETAERVAARFTVPVVEMSDLREMSYGVAEGKPQQWLDERLIGAPEDDRLDHRSIEGGETKREFVTRIYRAMDAILAEDSATQVIVTHGGTMTFVIAAWVGMPLEANTHIEFNSSSGGITYLHEDDQFKNRWVRFLNDTSHMTGVE